MDRTIRPPAVAVPPGTARIARRSSRSSRSSRSCGRRAGTPTRAAPRRSTLTSPDGPPPAAPPRRPGATAGPLLIAAGLGYVALGVALGGAWWLGEAQSSLFPTGWLLPAVLVVSGGLMVVRRRFDIVGVLWAGLVMAVFQLDLAVYGDATALGVDNPAAFDASILAAVLGLVPLVLRPGFRA